jgi:multidrug efflux pump subunit AcrA (membrane-fusion protein)
VQRTIVVIMLAGSTLLVSACRHEPAAQGAAAAPITVSTAPVTSTVLASDVEAGGVVTARATALISSRIMAPVVAVHVRAGDRVKRGTPLVIVDGRETDANRTRAIATLASATDTVRAADSEVRSAQAALTLARTTHDRIKTLHDKKSATTQELDQAVSALDVADAQFGQAQAHLSAANAAQDAARAASDAATVASSYTTLTAPFDGIVSERSVDPGSMANPGAGLLTLEDATGFRLEVPLDESRAATVKIGDTVGVNLGEGQFPDSLSGRVSEIARVDPASHSFIVKIDLPTQNGVRSGTFGRARFTGTPRNSLTVPTAAAVRRGQLTFVFAVDRENRARLRAVSPGSVDGDRLEILAGVGEKDVVITNPPPSLTDGAPVAGARQ